MPLIRGFTLKKDNIFSVSVNRKFKVKKDNLMFQLTKDILHLMKLQDRRHECGDVDSI